MPTNEIVEQFISRVEENKHDVAIKQFYTENASMQENNSEPRVGRDILIENEKKVLAKTKSLTSKCIRPVFIHENYVIIHWLFCFEWKGRATTKIEEIAYQL